MDLNEGSALGVFICELCELSSSHSFYGQKPPNTRAIVLLEECYGVKDPFSPERSFSFWDLSAVCAAKRCVWKRFFTRMLCNVIVLKYRHTYYGLQSVLHQALLFALCAGSPSAVSRTDSVRGAEEKECPEDVPNICPAKRSTLYSETPEHPLSTPFLETPDSDYSHKEHIQWGQTACTTTYLQASCRKLIVFNNCNEQQKKYCIYRTSDRLCHAHIKLSLKPRSHYKRHDPIHFNGELAISGDTRQQPLATGWGVSSDATKFRILQLYANEERLSGATANRKEDGRAHVIVLLSAVDKHTQWKKLQET